MSKFRITAVDWSEERSALALLRRQVFIEEQQVPEELEWDGFDDDAWHLLALDGHDTPIGTARMLSDGHIGRVAVVPHWRRRGVGRALMDAVIAIAREQGFDEVWLDAQTTALPFYRSLGFIAEGEEFIDAGIPHYRMRLRLDGGLAPA